MSRPENIHPTLQKCGSAQVLAKQSSSVPSLQSPLGSSRSGLNCQSSRGGSQAPSFDYIFRMAEAEQPHRGVPVTLSCDTQKILTGIHVLLYVLEDSTFA